MKRSMMGTGMSRPQEQRISCHLSGLLCIGCNAALVAYEKLSALSERVKLYLG